MGAGIEELLSRIYKGFLRYFVQGLQGVSFKVSKVLSLGLPRYFIEGFLLDLSLRNRMKRIPTRSFGY